MKKLLVYIDSLNNSGGIERIVYELIKEWKAFISVSVLTKDKGECYYGELCDICVTSIDSTRKLNMHNRFQRIFSTFINTAVSIAKLRKSKLDYDFYYVATPMNGLELYLAGVDSKKIIVSEHGSAYGVNRVYKCIKNFLYPKVKCISVPNTMDINYYSMINANVIYIPHLLYLKNRKKSSLNNKILLNCGRLTADKRQLLLLKIWAKISDKNGWSLLIVGSGEEKKNLEKFIDENQLNNSVRLIPAQKNIEELYQNSSCFVFTSRYEGFGLVLLEAMSYGLPCISFDCPSGPRDIINNNKSGFLVKNNDVEEFENKIIQLINMSKSDLLTFGNNAYNFANSWNNDFILKKWKSLFK